MRIPTDSYEVVFEQYSAAMKWMAALDITLGTGRTTNYEKTFSHWMNIHRAASVEDVNTLLPGFISSVLEIYDFINIYQAFRNVPPSQLSVLIEKLQKGVNGPINTCDETPASTTARNYLFEATVAAIAHRPDNGIEAILDAQSDTGIKFGGKKLWVECKRITSMRKIEKNVRVASRQLEKRLANTLGSSHRGIVALDISKIISNGDELYVAQDDENISKFVTQIMDAFIYENSHIWQNIYSSRNRKIIGTLIKCSFMATSEGRNLLVHTSNWAINPRTGITQSDMKIQEQLAEQLSPTQ